MFSRGEYIMWKTSSAHRERKENMEEEEPFSGQHKMGHEKKEEK